MTLPQLGAVDLNLLVALEALLAERSVTRAAVRLGLSQPATSHALGRLRALLEDPLLVRGPRGLVPTARGEALVAPLGLALDGVRRLLAPSGFDPATSVRTFSVAAADQAMLGLLPPLLSDLAVSAPGIDVVARAVPPVDIEAGLASGALDLSLGIHDAAPPGFYRQALQKERFVCVMAAGHAAARGRFGLDRFCHERHLLVAPRGTPGGVVDSRLEQLGRKRRVALVVSHFLVAPHVVARTDLLWTAPERIARTYAAMLPLFVRPLPAELDLAGFTVTQLWHERRHADPDHAWFREQVRAASRQS